MRRAAHRVKTRGKKPFWLEEVEHEPLALGEVAADTTIEKEGLGVGERRGNADLGWVSEQWLAEYRASHPS